MKRFTPTERNQLIQMVMQKKSDEEIGKILGRHKSSIYAKRIAIFGAAKKYRKRRKPVIHAVVKKAVGGGESDLQVTQRTLKALGYKLALIKLNEGN